MKKPISVERLPLSILAKLSKEVNEISKFFKKNNCTQVFHSLNNTREVFKIKEIFLNLQTNKIENIQRIIKGDSKSKLRINMTIKSLSRKHVIVPMSNNNKTKFIEESSAYVTNINRALKNIKSEIMADFAHSDQADITIVTNKVTSLLDFQTIEKYVKNTNCIKVDEVEVPYLLQLKSYLKIIDILYLVENTNTTIIADVVEAIIKSNHIFNNIIIAFRPHIIKVSSKSDIAII